MNNWKNIVVCACLFWKEKALLSWGGHCDFLSNLHLDRWEWVLLEAWWSPCHDWGRRKGWRETQGLQELLGQMKMIIDDDDDDDDPATMDMRSIGKLWWSLSFVWTIMIYFFPMTVRKWKDRHLCMVIKFELKDFVRNVFCRCVLQNFLYLKGNVSMVISKLFWRILDDDFISRTGAYKRTQPKKEQWNMWSVFQSRGLKICCYLQNFTKSFRYLKWRYWTL